MIFTDRERAYLTAQHLGRLATLAPDGTRRSARWASAWATTARSTSAVPS